MTIPLMPEGPNTSDPDGFDDKADNWIAKFNPTITQMNVDIAKTNDNVVAAAASAQTAIAKAQASAASASDAAGAAATATTQADRAAAAAVLADASAKAAQGMQLTTKSATSVTIDTGVKQLVVEAGRQFPRGVPIIAVHPADPNKFMAGTVESYVGTALGINVTSIGGSGAIVADWNVSIAGVKGGKGDTASNTEFTPVPMAALNIDCSLGNYFTKTIGADTVMTVSNVPTGFSFTLELQHTGGTLTLPAAVKASADLIPFLQSGKTHLFMFVTSNGGARWRVSVLPNYVT